MPCSWLLFTNQKWLNKLPAEDKKIVEESVALYHKILMEEYNKQIDATLKNIVDKYQGKVFRLSPEERQRWIDKSSAMYSTLPDNMKKLSEEIREVLK
jgi:TRAP-type C4-dicarboxylate transport system substrate-binding protein